MSLVAARSHRRILAHLFDQIIVLGLMSPVWIQAVVSFFRDRTFEIDLNILILCFLLQFCYKWLFLRFLGATIGKFIFGLRVVNKADGLSLGTIQSLIRVLTDQLSLLFGSAHRVLALARFDRTHLSDWVAETQVVQSRPRTDYPKRNIPIALILCLYLALTNFYQAYQFVQRTEFEHGKLITHPQIPSTLSGQ